MDNYTRSDSFENLSKGEIEKLDTLAEKLLTDAIENAQKEGSGTVEKRHFNRGIPGPAVYCKHVYRVAVERKINEADLKVGVKTPEQLERIIRGERRWMNMKKVEPASN